MCEPTLPPETPGGLGLPVGEAGTVMPDLAGDVFPPTLISFSLHLFYLVFQ